MSNKFKFLEHFGTIMSDTCSTEMKIGKELNKIQKMEHGGCAAHELSGNKIKSKKLFC
jgi:hypothetical protein